MIVCLICQRKTSSQREEREREREKNEIYAFSLMKISYFIWVVNKFLFTKSRAGRLTKRGDSLAGDENGGRG